MYIYIYIAACRSGNMCEAGALNRLDAGATVLRFVLYVDIYRNIIVCCIIPVSVKESFLLGETVPCRTVAETPLQPLI